MDFFKGSRYWAAAFMFLLLAFALSAYIVHTAGRGKIELVVGPLTLMLGGVASTLFGVMGIVKREERKPDSQAAYLERVKFDATQTPTNERELER